MEHVQAASLAQLMQVSPAGIWVQSWDQPQQRQLAYFSVVALNKLILFVTATCTSPWKVELKLSWLPYL